MDWITIEIDEFGQLRAMAREPTEEEWAEAERAWRACAPDALPLKTGRIADAVLRGDFDEAMRIADGGE